MRDLLPVRHSIISVLPCPFLSPVALVNYAHTIILNKRKRFGRVSEQPILRYKEIHLEIILRAALKHCLIRKLNLQMLVSHFQTEKAKCQEQQLRFLSGVSCFQDTIQGYNAGGPICAHPFVRRTTGGVLNSRTYWLSFRNAIIPPFPRCMLFASMDRTNDLDMDLQ